MTFKYVFMFLPVPAMVVIAHILGKINLEKMAGEEVRYHQVKRFFRFRKEGGCKVHLIPGKFRDIDYLYFRKPVEKNTSAGSFCRGTIHAAVVSRSGTAGRG